jgi:hypothetical protein
MAALYDDFWDDKLEAEMDMGPCDLGDDYDPFWRLEAEHNLGLYDPLWDYDYPV